MAITIINDGVTLRELTKDGFTVLLFTLLLPNGKEIIVKTIAGTVEPDDN